MRDRSRGGRGQVAPLGGPSRSTLRCAIYTRKSTEEGLEQDFNSLDAQREACAAYILSQRHEGWTLIPEYYDDGGYSGGNMDRPAMRQLLADMKAGKVDVIVVYKVDRLTRSLADFAKIVDVLDGAGASFVSVTQAFNTTTSMGRLTLNVLLSFAQFEREVTSERIRDKIAASKAKGMWMGGPVPLGYHVQDRKLVICDEEAAAVRMIFERYAALRSLNLLEAELYRCGVRSKQRSFASGRKVGGGPFRKGGLAHLLENPVYVGEVRHKGVCFPGEHDAIINRELWDEVQMSLATNRREHRIGARAEQPSLLSGMLFDHEGRAMSPDHSVKGSLRYRYYVSRAEAGEAPIRQFRLPAGEIEQLVRDRLAAWLSDPGKVAGSVGSLKGISLQDILARSQSTAEGLRGSSMPTQRDVLQTLEAKVHLEAERIVLWFSLDPGVRCELNVPARLASRGQETRLVFRPDDRDAPARIDSKLVNLIAKAFAARERFERECLADVPATGVAHLTRLARLSYLAPDIITSILEGRQPTTLTSRELLRISSLPIDWGGQRRALRFA